MGRVRKSEEPPPPADQPPKKRVKHEASDGSRETPTRKRVARPPVVPAPPVVPPVPTGMSRVIPGIDPDVLARDYTMCFYLDQAFALRKFIDGMSSIFPELCLLCGPEGILINAAHQSGGLVVSVGLDHFDAYYLSRDPETEGQDLLLGVEPGRLARALSGINPTDTLTVGMKRSARYKLLMHAENHAEHSSCDIQFSLSEVDITHLRTPPQRPAVIIRFPAKVFNGVVASLRSYSQPPATNQTATVTLCTDSITFQAQGMDDTYEKTFHSSEVIGFTCPTGATFAPMRVQYLVSFLESVKFASQQTEDILLMFSPPDRKLIVQMEVGTLGKMRFCIFAAAAETGGMARVMG